MFLLIAICGFKNPTHAKIDSFAQKSYFIAYIFHRTIQYDRMWYLHQNRYVDGLYINFMSSYSKD